MGDWKIVVLAQGRTREEAEENAGLALDAGDSADDAILVGADPAPEGLGAIWEPAFELPHGLASLGSEARQWEWDGSPWWTNRVIALRAEHVMHEVEGLEKTQTRHLPWASTRREIPVMWREVEDNLELGRRMARSGDDTRIVDIRYVEAVEACTTVTWWGGVDPVGPVEARDVDGRVIALLMPCRK